ncbi:MAG: leucine--tRNA ligase [Bacteroidia bacterium]|nr:leucine--tRNA ligase [Bacteroidia bacterium]
MEPIRQYSAETIAQLEDRWQQYWDHHQTYVAPKTSDKPKYYVLDMFPYPSGAGLHVGHPLGYIASDILARFKRLQGYNVLHPMGFDAFGLPAEQYAIQTGTHPAITTERNIQTFLGQMRRLGLGHDPTTQLRTSDPGFYRWTQWVFLRLFGAWYNQAADRAEPIETLVGHFERQGSAGVDAHADPHDPFTAQEWLAWDEPSRQRLLLHYRLAYLSYDFVNWCPALGTVLANEEVKDGVSERGGHPVERIRMRQWALRITAYAEKLLRGLDTIDWPDSIKEQQRNWIGRSVGARIRFNVQGQPEAVVEVFTTRPDTVFGATFLVLAPEHPLVESLVTAEAALTAQPYIAWASNRTERERSAEKEVSGVFTGSYAVHPFTGAPLPIWVADYVLVGYGTGAIMAVPGHDERDWAFATRFGLPICEVVVGGDLAQGAYSTKEGTLINSDFLDRLAVPEAIARAIGELEARGLGEGRTTYRLRDAVFSRQRYWGEPFPIVYREGLPYGVPDDELPVTLPEVESYQPTGQAESPLAAVTDWVERPDGSVRETNTMPGWAGSSWYFFRYFDTGNDSALAGPERLKYWAPVDFYIGGAEHAVGHLLYARFWTHFLYDLGHVPVAEFARRLVNQGMIQGVSQMVYKERNANVFVSADSLAAGTAYIEIHCDVHLVQGEVLNLEGFRAWRPEYAQAQFVVSADGKFRTRPQVEKMSKSKYNVVNPDTLCDQYGADTFRMYEMFLGPLEASKPWDTQGITGVHGFLRRFWRLFYDEAGQWRVQDAEPTPAMLKQLHQTLKKVADDCERLSFNTAVAQFMITVNELTKLGCQHRAVLEPLVVCLSPFAPHLAEELWRALGHTTSIVHAQYPTVEERYLVEAEFEYPISVNGKVRAKLLLPLDLPAQAVEAQVLALEEVQRWMGGSAPKKVVVVPGRIVNVVV